MKNCPRCGKTYPDSETFCEDDGAALSATPSGGGRATTVMSDDAPPAGSTTECPVCGGKAQPGEVICNFCGTRLAPDDPEAKAPASGVAPTRPRPETYVPASDRPAATAHQAAGRGATGEEDASSDRGFAGILGFVIAAILALAGGAWLAIDLSGHHAGTPVAQASPSPTAVASPTVTLAKTIAVQVSGDLTGASQRDTATLTKVFAGNKTTLEDVYRHALDGNAGLSEGLIVRLHLLPDGSVSDASVRVSTAPNPSLDAEVVRAAAAWKFDPSTGAAVEVDYPVIMATTGDTAAIETDLSSKLASLTPASAPEYAMAPASPIAALPSPAPSPSAPELAAVPPAPENAPTKPRKHRPPPNAIAAVPPTPRISERLNDELKADRKLRRVQAYATGGSVTLNGKVFDDNDKALAEQTARGVSGVTTVTNNLTTDTQDWVLTAGRISAQLQSAGLSGVTAKVIGTSVYLSGTVKSAPDKERAVTVAQAAAPITVRENLIRVDPDNVFGF